MHSLTIASRQETPIGLYMLNPKNGAVPRPQRHGGEEDAGEVTQGIKNDNNCSARDGRVEQAEAKVTNKENGIIRVRTNPSRCETLKRSAAAIIVLNFGVHSNQDGSCRKT